MLKSTQISSTSHELHDTVDVVMSTCNCHPCLLVYFMALSFLYLIIFILVA